MRETRRRFVLALAAGSGLAAHNVLALGQQQQHRGLPDPPPPAFPKDQDAADAKAATARAARKALAQQNEKEFHEGVDRLHQLTGELQEEVQKTATTSVLSVRMFKKTEEIEKLAKQLKGKVKGG